MTKRIEVSLARQSLCAFDGSNQVFTFDCVTGASDHPTEPGTFHVFNKDKLHVSHKYHVKMYYALFFTHDGKAIHQYHGPAPLSVVRTLKEQISGWFGSHGCVRLVETDAKSIFDWTPIGTIVRVI